uniref:Glutathione peroxidase n=1 Tax=Syphacia muris TaxID=451379 RepID=A0A158R4W4_9BILA
MATKTFYEFSAKDIDGNEVSMGKYKGNVVVVVNVASKCGFTDKNYKQLGELLTKYKDQGLRVAAFPCNQFAHQEPSCELDIKNFVNDNYTLDADFYSKVNVNGSNAHPLFNFLKHEQHGFLTDAIKWNFTKFLVDKSGNVVKRYSPNTAPLDMTSDIEKLLKDEKL